MFCLHSAAAIVAALPKLAQTKSWPAPAHLPVMYVEVVSNVDTHTFSADAVLWTACVASHNNSAKQQDLLWDDSVDATIRNRYWLFAENGLGDVYVLDGQGGCYFADHDEGSLHPSFFTPLLVDFAGWLQLADLMGQCDAILDGQDELSGTQIAAFNACLAQLHPDLPASYPYQL